MAGLVRIKLNRQAVGELLKSDEIRADLEERGRRIAQAAGPDHEVETFVGRVRTRVTVRTTTPSAAFHEATDRTLTRAIDSGRG